MLYTLHKRILSGVQVFRPIFTYSPQKPVVPERNCGSKILGSLNCCLFLQTLTRSNSTQFDYQYEQIALQTWFKLGTGFEIRRFKVMRFKIIDFKLGDFKLGDLKLGDLELGDSILGDFKSELCNPFAQTLFHWTRSKLRQRIPFCIITANARCHSSNLLLAFRFSPSHSDFWSRPVVMLVV